MRRFLVVLASVAALSMPVLGTFAVGPALPAIAEELERGIVEPRFIETVYLVGFAAFVLAGGSLGDRFGRKRLLLWGIVVFTASSAACGLSQSTDQLIAARAAQGLGAALLAPATLSNLAAGLRERGRGFAVGLWAAVSVVAALYSPLIGAYVVEHHSWEWVFFMNVPVGVAALLFAAAATESGGPLLLRRFDLAGAFLGTAGVGCLAYALVEGNLRGWRDQLILGSLAFAALFLVLFLLVETRRARPMVSLGFAGNATFSASNAVAAAIFFAVFGLGIFMTAYLRNVLAYSANEAAERLVPFAAAMVVLAPLAGYLSDRIGSRALMTCGSLAATAGLGLLLRANLEPSYQNVVLPALLLTGCGMSLVAGPMTTAVTGVVNQDQVGGAAGAANAARQLGLIIGLALMGTVVTAAFRNSFLGKLIASGVDSSAAQSIVDTAPARSVAMGGPVEALRGQIPPGTAPEVLENALRAGQQSFVDGMHSGMLLSIGFLLLAALISVVFVKNHVVSLFRVQAQPPAPEPQQGPASTQEPPGDAPAGVSSTDPSPTPASPLAIPKPVPEAEPEGEPEIQAEGEPAASVAPAREPEAPEPPGDLATILFQLPYKAGSETVVKNVTGFLRATLPYYAGSATPAVPAAALPEPIAANINASTSADIATLAGYLLLEQRFGRINPETRPELAATALVGTARSINLWTFPETEDSEADDFLEDLVKVVVNGIGPVPPNPVE